jgi:hypothetical protein
MNYPNRLHKWNELDRYLLWVCYSILSAALLFVCVASYRFVGRNVYSKTPDDLISKIQQAQNHIAEEHVLQFEDSPYENLARQRLEPILLDSYRIGVWHPSVCKTRLRAMPELYPPQSLLAWAGNGTFPIAASASPKPQQPPIRDISPVGTKNTRGYYWAVVTGIIEDANQIEAYELAFGGSSYRNPKSDCPDYQFFEVERAEISGDFDGDDLRWVKHPVRAMFDLNNLWAGMEHDSLDAKFFPPPRNGIGFVFPLCPSMKDALHEDAMHPRIARYEEELRDRTAVEPDRPAIDVADPFENFPRPRPTQKHLSQIPVVAPSAKPDIMLLRYIDYGVEPGKKYRYRIRLVLQNPNWKVAKKFLETEDLGESQYLRTEWSRPSPIVAVPPATKIELLAVDPRHGRATVKLIHFDLLTGEYLAKEFKVERGQVMNYPREAYSPPDETTSQNENPFGRLIPELRKLPEPRRVDFMTNATLLDIRPGIRSAGVNRSSGISSILILDGDGKTIVIEENERSQSTPPVPANRRIAETTQFRRP